MSITEQAQKHPGIALGVLAVGFIILYVLMSSGGSSAAAVSSGPSAADSNLQLAEIQTAGALQATQIQADSADRKTAVEAQLGALALNAGLLGKYSDNDTALKITGINADVNRYGIQAGADVSKYGISAQEAVSLGQQQQVTDIAAITSAVNIAGINANRDTSIENTRALADANRYSAGLSHDISTQQINAARHADNNKTTSDIFGNILGAAGSLLAFL